MPELTPADLEALITAKIDLTTKGADEPVAVSLSALEGDTLALTNSMLEEICAAEAEAIRAVLSEVVNKLTDDDVEVQRVLFVGGSSRLQMVQNVTRTFLSGVFTDVQYETPRDPDMAVAEGAALYALSDAQIGGSQVAHAMPKVADVTARGIGVQTTQDGDKDVMCWILPRYSEYRSWGANSVTFENVNQTTNIHFKVRAGLEVCHEHAS
jgi:molecular chaperone DnaK (HSP70)